jgi:glycosyltransferase involved in cell wall biosynthesis
MRLATCTPVDYAADTRFFTRDSGLLCHGFRMAGHDAWVVMPGVSRPGETPGVLRGTTEELESADWWRAQGFELVVLYAWCDPKYRNIAEAVRAAGARLVQNLDTGGMFTPYGGFMEWFRVCSTMGSGPQRVRLKFLAFARAMRDLFPFVYEKKRLAMMDCSDAIAVVSEPAAASLRSYAAALGHPELNRKIMVVPHPVSPKMRPGAEKSRHVLVVGRWRPADWHQKDPRLTIQVLNAFLADFPSWTAEIVGSGGGDLGKSAACGEGVNERLMFRDEIPHGEMAARYQKSSIILCCSRYESFHIASAEALCCGCSVVVASHPLLASTAWFTTRDSGTVARDRSPCSLVEALSAEARAWESGSRDATAISARWTPSLGAREIAEAIPAAVGLVN